MRNILEKHMLKIWIIASIIATLIVHFLFYYPAPYRWMVANWGAGEILTYISTVALSLLAVWQNKRFKAENDLSQARLEKLAKHANELSLINKIIEIEKERLNNVKEAMDDFENACNLKLIANEFIKKSPIKIFSVTVRSEVEHEINQSLFKLLRLLRIDYSLDASNSPLCKAIIAYYNLTMEIVKSFDNDNINAIGDDKLASYREGMDNFLKQSEHYIRSLESKLDQIIYGDKSLEEIKKLYHDRLIE